MGTYEQRWVEVEWIVLPATHRSDNLPEDTRQVPYRARARGLAADRQELGGDADVVTLAGRTLSGTVVDTAPGYSHSFGRPLEAWVEMREEIRMMLREPGR